MSFEDGLLCPPAKEHIDRALGYWRQSTCNGDEYRRAAFLALREAFGCVCGLDIRLYLYLHSDEAALLYQAYEREVDE